PTVIWRTLRTHLAPLPPPMPAGLGPPTRTPHFSISFATGISEADQAHVKQRLEEAYERVKGYLPLPPGTPATRMPIRVEVSPDVPIPGAFGGVLTLPVSKQGKPWDLAAEHEITHLLLHYGTDRGSTRPLLD